MNSLEMATTVKKISFGFFFLLGIGHFTAVGFSALTAKILFLPFVLSGIAYAYGVTKEHLLFNGNYGRAADYIFLTFSIVSLAGLLILQFSFSDA